MTLATLKEKINALEQQLLAISSLNDICQQSINHGNQPVNLESCAELLNHLIEPAMYQVESVRMLTDELLEQSESNTSEEVALCS